LEPAELLQASAYVVTQQAEAGFSSARLCPHNEISWLYLPAEFAQRGSQAAFHTVANHSLADGLADDKADVKIPLAFGAKRIDRHQGSRAAPTAPDRRRERLRRPETVAAGQHDRAGAVKRS
jgi:hypothetical protein